MTEPWNPWWARRYAEYTHGAALLGQAPLSWESYQRARDGMNAAPVLEAERVAWIWAELDCVAARGYTDGVWWYPVTGDPPAELPDIPVRVAVYGDTQQFSLFERWLRAGWTIIWLGAPSAAAAALAAEFSTQFHCRDAAPESLPRVLAELRERLREAELSWADTVAARLRARLGTVRRDLDTYEAAVQHRAIQLGHDPRAGRFTRPLNEVEIAEVRGWDKPRADYLDQIAQIESALADAESKHARAQQDLTSVRQEQQLRKERQASVPLAHGRPADAASVIAAADHAEYADLLATDRAARALAELDKQLTDWRGTEAVRLHASAPQYLQRRFSWITAAHAEIAKHTPALDASTFLAWLDTSVDAQLDCTVVDRQVLTGLTWQGVAVQVPFNCAERRLARALNLIRGGAELDEVCAAIGVDVSAA